MQIEEIIKCNTNKMQNINIFQKNIESALKKIEKKKTLTGKTEIEREFFSLGEISEQKGAEYKEAYSKGLNKYNSIINQRSELPIPYIPIHKIAHRL